MTRLSRPPRALAGRADVDLSRVERPAFADTASTGRGERFGRRR